MLSVVMTDAFIDGLARSLSPALPVLATVSILEKLGGGGGVGFVAAIGNGDWIGGCGGVGGGFDVAMVVAQFGAVTVTALEICEPPEELAAFT